MSEALTSIPRFNHVALTVASEMLSGETGTALKRFYGEVFGWGEMPSMGKEGELIVLRVHSHEQFVYLHAGEKPLRCPPTDHFGLQVATPQELDDVLDRARKYQESDGRVEITDRQEQDFKAVVLYSVYIRYLLPMCIELQCYEWAEGFDAQTMPG